MNWHIHRHDGDDEGEEHRQDFKKEEEQSVTIFYDHEGPHRSKAGRAAMMRNVYNDTKTPSRVRGWIQQELNRGCNFSNMRLPPGCALAHQRGCEAQKGFDYSYTTLVDKLCHKLQHKYDRVGGIAGARNKTNSLIAQHIQRGGDFEGRTFRSMSERLDWFEKNKRPYSRMRCFVKPLGAVKRSLDQSCCLQVDA